MTAEVVDIAAARAARDTRRVIVALLGIGLLAALCYFGRNA